MSPIPVVIRKKGATILTAASASLPAPCPTKAPSATLIVAERSMPNSVGKNILRNNTGIFIVPKSILSLCICFKLKVFKCPFSSRFPKTRAKVGLYSGIYKYIATFFVYSYCLRSLDGYPVTYKDVRQNRQPFHPCAGCAYGQCIEGQALRGFGLQVRIAPFCSVLTTIFAVYCPFFSCGILSVLTRFRQPYLPSILR